MNQVLFKFQVTRIVEGEITTEYITALTCRTDENNNLAFLDGDGILFYVIHTDNWIDCIKVRNE
jgi:hypothetical protein